jgi:hypothetical protein
LTFVFLQLCDRLAGGADNTAILAIAIGSTISLAGVQMDAP